MGVTREQVVKQAQAWIGKNEKDGTHKEIIDIYNKAPKARGYQVKYTDPWCATFVSAVSIKCGATDIIPTECGCGQMVELFKSLGEWVEDDNYKASPGDIIFYDWQDSGKGDNTGSPDHVGIIEKVGSKNFTVIEGNKSDAVSRRTIAIGGKYIRGFGVPKYAGTATKTTKAKTEKKETAASGAPSKTVKWKGVVTATALNVRSWAGKENTRLKSYPVIYKGKVVEVCDTVKASNGDAWYYIRIDGKVYGFVHSDYIKKQ